VSVVAAAALKQWLLAVCCWAQLAVGDVVALR
jgi:hypothetical protein